MHVITEILHHQAFASSFLIDDEVNVPKLKVAAQVFIHAMAWRQTRGVGNALAVLKQHPEFEPTDDELAERIHPSFGWREAIQWAAYLAIKNKLDADLAAEIQLLQTSITLATITGRRVVGLIPIGADANPPEASDLTILVQRDGYREAVWLDLELMPQDDEDACPEDPDGLHFPDCGCDVWPQI